MEKVSAISVEINVATFHGVSWNFCGKKRCLAESVDSANPSRNPDSFLKSCKMHLFGVFNVLLAVALFNCQSRI